MALCKWCKKRISGTKNPGFWAGIGEIFVEAYFFNPISLSRSSRYSPAVASGYAFGWALSTVAGRQARLISPLGCKKKGIENLDVCHISRGGFTTRWVVDLSLLLVRRCSISPTFTTIWSGKDTASTHSFC